MLWDILPCVHMVKCVIGTQAVYIWDNHAENVMWEASESHSESNIKWVLKVSLIQMDSGVPDFLGVHYSYSSVVCCAVVFTSMDVICWRFIQFSSNKNTPFPTFQFWISSNYIEAALIFAICTELLLTSYFRHNFIILFLTAQFLNVFWIDILLFPILGIKCSKYQLTEGWLEGGIICLTHSKSLEAIENGGIKASYKIKCRNIYNKNYI